MSRSTRLLILIKNMYTLYSRKRFLLPLTYFSTNVAHPFTLRVTGIKIYRCRYASNCIRVRIKSCPRLEFRIELKICAVRYQTLSAFRLILSQNGKVWLRLFPWFTLKYSNYLVALSIVIWAVTIKTDKVNYGNYLNNCRRCGLAHSCLFKRQGNWTAVNTVDR